MVNKLVNAERWGSDLDLETCTSKSPLITPPQANRMWQVSPYPERPRGGRHGGRALDCAKVATANECLRGTPRQEPPAHTPQAHAPPGHQTTIWLH